MDEGVGQILAQSNPEFASHHHHHHRLRSLRTNNPTTTQRRSSLERLAASFASATKTSSSIQQSRPHSSQTSYQTSLEDITSSNTSVASRESGLSSAVASSPSGDTLFLRSRPINSNYSIGEGDMRSSKPTILPRISRTGSSPYTHAYESLNGNGGISRTIYAWRRFLIGGTLLIILAWASLGWNGLAGATIDGMSQCLIFNSGWMLHALLPLAYSLPRGVCAGVDPEMHGRSYF
jgi:hypothetical protein